GGEPFHGAGRGLRNELVEASLAHLANARHHRERIPPAHVQLSRRGQISGARLESGTTTTESSRSFCVVFETTIPGRTFPSSGGDAGWRLIQETPPRLTAVSAWAE